MFYLKIKRKERKEYNESPCIHCQPWQISTHSRPSSLCYFFHALTHFPFPSLDYLEANPRHCIICLLIFQYISLKKLKHPELLEKFLNIFVYLTSIHISFILRYFWHLILICSIWLLLSKNLLPFSVTGCELCSCTLACFVFNWVSGLTIVKIDGHFCCKYLLSLLSAQ